jgi:hypothetical protein
MGVLVMLSTTTYIEYNPTRPATIATNINMCYPLLMHEVTAA